ncbi:MAG: hypothetical protein EXR20_03425 [Bacteroidetes bacterium]|nr:hypothetical protein [Bacteroidota bacterium]
MKKSYSFIYCIISVLLLSCSSKRNEEQEINRQEYTTSYFQIKIPANWKMKKAEGLDVQSLAQALKIPLI